MVDTAAITGICFTLLLSFVFPVLVFIVYGVRNRGKGIWHMWFSGAAGFFIPQILIRLPILQFLTSRPDFTVWANQHCILYLFLLALTAGLFELAGRLAVAFCFKKNMTFEKGMAAGLGHGAIESIFLIGTAYINNLIFVIMINSGFFNQFLTQIPVEAEAPLLQIKTALLETDSILFYLAGFERILAMILQTALSLLICYCVWKGKTLYGILICLVLHFLADFVPVLFSSLATPQLGNLLSPAVACFILYTFLIILAVLSVAMIKNIKKRWKGNKA